MKSFLLNIFFIYPLVSPSRNAVRKWKDLIRRDKQSLGATRVWWLQKIWHPTKILHQEANHCRNWRRISCNHLLEETGGQLRLEATLSVGWENQVVCAQLWMRGIKGKRGKWRECNDWIVFPASKGYLINYLALRQWFFVLMFSQSESKTLFSCYIYDGNLRLSGLIFCFPIWISVHYLQNYWENLCSVYTQRSFVLGFFFFFFPLWPLNFSVHLLFIFRNAFILKL